MFLTQVVFQDKNQGQSRNKKAGLIAIISFLTLIVVGLGIAVVLLQSRKAGDLRDSRALNPETDERPGQPAEASPKPINYWTFRHGYLAKSLSRNPTRL